MTAAERSLSRSRWIVRFFVLMGLLVFGPVSVLVSGQLDLDTHWRDARKSASGLAPHPDEEPAAIVQVYGARAYSWRGAFGIHTWIATKRQDASHYLVYQVIGWNLYRGRSSVSVDRVRSPDFAWFNSPAVLLHQRRGPLAEALIDRIQTAVDEYPYAHAYRLWPGPNSNTFTAYVAREVPELGVDLPPTAIGKDYIAGGNVVGRMPSGSGWQVSLLGLLGIGIAWEEGIEINILGLSAGVDVNDLALRLPGLGRVNVMM